jgi:hypothetical protein
MLGSGKFEIHNWQNLFTIIRKIDNTLTPETFVNWTRKDNWKTYWSSWRVSTQSKRIELWLKYTLVIR